MNKIIQALRQGMQQKLIIGNASSPVIPIGESLYVAVNIGIDKILLKSVEVTCNKNTEFRVEFFEEQAMTNSRYNSGNVTQENYDVLDLPYIDKDETQVMHFLIHNLSNFETEYTLEVRGISMK